MKFFIIFITIFFALSCNNERSTSKATVKLFIKYASEKNMDKIYEMLTPESKNKYSKGKDQLIRSDFQINRYNVKSIRARNRDKEKELYYMEIILKDGKSGFITLKRIKNKFYIKLD
jgi:hypothetical protein